MLEQLCLEKLQDEERDRLQRNQLQLDTFSWMVKVGGRAVQELAGMTQEQREDQLSVAGGLQQAADKADKAFRME